MNKNKADRVQEDLEKWLKREQRFQKIFSRPLADNRSFLKEKLKYYDTIKSKYGNVATREESTTLRLMKEDRGAIERQLYPNAIVRLAFRITLKIRNEINSQKDQRQNQANLQELRSAVHRLGLPENAFSERHLRQERDIPPFTYQVGENEQMTFDWDLSQEQDGAYKFNGYTATLNIEGEPQRTQRFPVEGTDTMTAGQAYNLLSGRSVQIGTEKDLHWVKLDLNDKDRDGNHKVKRFYANYNYSLKDQLAKIPINSLTNSGQMKMVEGALRNGDRIKIQLTGGEFLSIEANPQHRSIDCYREGRKIPFSQVTKARSKRNKKHRVHGRLGKGTQGIYQKRVIR